MRHTNINIDSPYGYMYYFLEYQNDAANIDKTPYYRICENDSVAFYMGDCDMLSRHGNEWTPTDASVAKLPVMTTTTEGRPTPLKAYNISSINIYFPRFSVETYNKKVKYALDISTFVHGRMISLGSYLIDRNDVLACDGIKKFANEDYYEYLNVRIIDPWYIVYDEDWKKFRQDVCGERDYDEGGSIYELNSTGSVIQVSLHPVVLCNDGIYREMDDYLGGQNAINLADTVEDYMTFTLSDNRNDNSMDEYALRFKTSMLYNDAYEKTVDGFKEYMKETYLLDTYKMYVEVVVQDDKDIFRHIMQEVNSPWQAITRDELSFDSWDGYHEGMYINAFLHIYTTTPSEFGQEHAFIYLRSNRILLTKDLFRYLVDPLDIHKIQLDIIDMKTYNINAVNKIQQNIIQMSRPDDYKANIIKPIFFRVKELANIIIHPAVTENICINLDQYKSKVGTFILKIENTSFIEFGRTSSGVIFKVIGSSLANEQSSGTYYILNQDSELVTSGKYTYES